jgi:hypothetical protein
MSWLITGSEKNPVDLFRSNVSLLLNGEGNTIVDSSLSPKTITALGNAATSSTQKKFGDKSIFFDGNGDLLRVASDTGLQLGTGDFTLELWCYLTGRTNGFGPFFDFRTVGETQANILFGFLSTVGGGTDATLKLFVSGSVRILGGDLPLNQWVHIALARQSGNTKMFIDGTQAGSTYTDTNNYTSSIVRVGGNVLENAFLQGYIDDLRITKGIARYTANFTPPTAPFPDI